MQIIKTINLPTLKEIEAISDLAETLPENANSIPSFIINDHPGYDMFWLRDHQKTDAKNWTKIQLVTYTEAELNAL